MMEFVYPTGAVCDVSRPLVTVKEHHAMPKPSTKQNINELYRALRAAKTKAEAGAAMRRFIVWNDIPDDIWEKLEDMFPTVKVYK